MERNATGPDGTRKKSGEHHRDNHTSVGKYAIAVWRHCENGDVTPTGKSYRLNTDNSLVKSGLHLYANQMRTETFDDIETLFEIIEAEDTRGCFFTSGQPDDWRNHADSAEWRNVALKAAQPTSGSDYVKRTKDVVKFRDDVGALFVIDFDSDWCLQRRPDLALPSPEQVLDAVVTSCRLRGLELGEVRWLCYRSSSSSLVRMSDGHTFDKGGFHLIALTDQASALNDFRDNLEIYLAIDGHAYGGLSKSGDFLKRGFMDPMAVRCNQPIFMAPVHHGRGLRVERDVRFLGGTQNSFDANDLKEPTDTERRLAASFWLGECEALKPRGAELRATWEATQIAELRAQNPNTSEEQAKKIVRRRLRCQLLGSDQIHFDRHGVVSVATVLANPKKFDGETCADPAEPEYGGGTNVAIFYANPETNCPMVFSYAHGGKTYEVFFDLATATDYLQGLGQDQALEELSRIIGRTYTSNDAEVDVLFQRVKERIKGVTKEGLRKSYGTKLVEARTRRVWGDEPNDDEDQVSSIEYRAARELARNETIACARNGLWRYTGTHWTQLDDNDAGRRLLQIFRDWGWPQSQGRVTSAVKQAVESLKHQTFVNDPSFFGEGQRVINCTNGELWFRRDGSVELRPHNPESGLISAPTVTYDPEAKAAIFQRTLMDMFMPPAELWAGLDTEGRRKARATVKELVRHVEEVLAYLLIPDRWIAVWFLLIGSGTNGKTKLIEILQMLLPTDSVISERLNNIAENQHGMARLIGKTLYVDDDLRTGIVLPDDFLKQISEGKHLSANVKHHPKDVVFYNRCGVVVLSNNYPKLVDISVGTRRRMHVIEFPRRFYLPSELAAMDKAERRLKRRDAANINLLDELKDELPGILNVLVRAYGRLRNRGDFDIPAAVRAATKKALVMANPLLHFIEEECVVGAELYAPRSDFQTNLRDWNYQQSNQWRPSPQQTKKQMEDLGFKVTRRRDGDRVVEAYTGLSLKDKPNVSLVRSLARSTQTKGARQRKRQEAHDGRESIDVPSND